MQLHILEALWQFIYFSNSNKISFMFVCEVRVAPKGGDITSAAKEAPGQSKEGVVYTKATHKLFHQTTADKQRFRGKSCLSGRAD